MNNKAAWERIKSEGLTVDAQVTPNNDGTYTARVGGVDKGRWFAFGFMGKKKFPNEAEARRDTRAVARAISRETGMPLHPSVPPERYKQIPSYTIGRAELKAMHEAQQRQVQAEYEDSPKGKLAFFGVAIVFGTVCLGGMYATIWIMSLL